MAVRFDASGDRLRRTANLPSSTSFTVSGWGYYVAARGNYAYLASLGSAASNSGQWIDLGWTNGNVFQLSVGGGGSSSANFSAGPSVGSAFFWAIVVSGTGAGNAIGYWRAPGSSTWNTAAGATGGFTPAVLDFGSNSWNEWTSTRLWNIKVWDRALSADELLIESYYEKPQFPGSINFWWELHNASDTTDKSGNGRDATVQGTLTTEDSTVRLWVPRRRIILPASAAGPTIVGATKAGAWSVRNTVSQNRAGAWSVRNLASQTRAGAWSVRAGVSTTKAGAWSVRNYASQTRAGAWSVFNYASQTRAGAWSVRALIAASRPGAWSVRSLVSDTRAGAWSVRSLVATTKSGAWSVEAGGPTIVSVTRSGAWSVRNLASDTRGGAWSVRAGVATTKAGAWSVRASVATTKAGAWSIRNYANASKAGAWSIRNTAAVTRGGSWSVRNMASATRSGAWSVGQAFTVLATRSGAWSVRNLVTALLPGAWSVGDLPRQQGVIGGGRYSDDDIRRLVDEKWEAIERPRERKAPIKARRETPPAPAQAPLAPPQPANPIVVPGEAARPLPAPEIAMPGVLRPAARPAPAVPAAPVPAPAAAPAAVTVVLPEGPSPEEEALVLQVILASM